MKSKEKLVIGKTRIDPGQVLDIRLKISETYTGDPIAIPLRVVRASKAGPTLFICAAVHGNELSGTGVVHELMFQKTLQLTKGTVILIPVVNVFGFETNQRNLPDRRDLNRCFPGTSREAWPAGSQQLSCAKSSANVIMGSISIPLPSSGPTIPMSGGIAACQQ